MNLIIFDTETIGKVSQDLLNIGYKIIDLNIATKEFKTLVEKDYLVSELYNNKVYCINDDFVGIEKYQAYENLLKDKKIIKHSLKKIFELMKKDIEKFKVNYGYAYNCNFDIDKFYKSSEKYELENPIQNLQIFDIWGYACESICNTEDYKKYCLNHNILTESKIYIKSTVESVIQYLTNDLNFIEDHTALSDTQHETNILIECFKRGCDITKWTNKQLIKSNVIQELVINVNGENQKIEYTKTYTRNGVTYYKI